MTETTIISSKEDAKKMSLTINEIINHHEYMKGSYFWNSPGIASMRRNYESTHSRELFFIFKDYNVILECRTSCSAKHIYYKGKFYINDQLKTLASVKKILKEIEKYANEE